MNPVATAVRTPPPPVTEWDRVRALLKNVHATATLWRKGLDELAEHTGARVLFSTIGSSMETWLGKAVRKGSARYEAAGVGGLRMMATGKENMRLEWSGFAPTGVVALNMLMQFASRTDHNFLVRMGADPASALRFSNASITHVPSASVLRRDNSKLFLLSWVIDEHYSSLFIDGELTLQKRRSERAPFDRVVVELLGLEAADTEAEVHGIELWDLEPGRAFMPLEGQSTENLLKTVSARVRNRDLNGVAAAVANFDGIDLAPLATEVFELLDHLLALERGYRDWAFDLVLSGLPPDVAAEWRRTRARKIPQPIVSVKNLTVRYYRNPAKRLALIRLLTGREAEIFEVLKDINFSVYPGEIIGIIGVNGAGKSTLLRTMMGLVPIHGGEIELRSRPLMLTPGLGLREELSGRDNVFLASCFMGLTTADTLKIFDDIVDFSELRESIDKPFKFYSDGMKSRLVFSIATAIAPDLIMLDELLGAGDIGFQRKAARRLDEMINRAKTVIVVTHGIQFVLQKCTKALLISQGKEVAFGSPETVVARYLDLIQAQAGSGLEGGTAHVQDNEDAAFLA